MMRSEVNHGKNHYQRVAGVDAGVVENQADGSKGPTGHPSCFQGWLCEPRRTSRRQDEGKRLQRLTTGRRR